MFHLNRLNPTGNAVIAIGFSLVVLASLSFPLWLAIKGVPLYRDLHFGGAVYMSQDSITLFSPVIPGFDLAQKPVPQEPAIWQALTAGLFKLLGPFPGWANLVSSLAFCSVYFPIFWIATTYYNKRVAWLSVLCLSTQALVFVWSGMASTDSFSVALSIWWFYFLIRYARKGGPQYLTLCVICAPLAATAKPPFFLAVAVAGILQMFPWRDKQLRLATGLLVSGSIALIGFIFWQYYCNIRLGELVYPKKELRLSFNPEMWGWYFGGWSERLSPDLWLKSIYRTSNMLLGGYLMVSALIGGIVIDRGGFATKWLMGFGLSFLIFTNLVLFHQHYYLMLSPPVAILTAITLNFIVDRISKSHSERENSAKIRVIITIVAVFTLVLNLAQGLVSSRVWMALDTYPETVAEVIRNQVSPSERILIAHGGWGGDILIRSNRSGYSLGDFSLLESEEFMQIARDLGYKKLVMLSESPMVAAFRQSNPGQSGANRLTWSSYAPCFTDNWLLVFQNEDISIREIMYDSN
jgi:hypothetical protein